MTSETIYNEIREMAVFHGRLQDRIISAFDESASSKEKILELNESVGRMERQVESLSRQFDVELPSNNAEKFKSTQRARQHDQERMSREMRGDLKKLGEVQEKVGKWIETINRCSSASLSEIDALLHRQEQLRIQCEALEVTGNLRSESTPKSIPEPIVELGAAEGQETDSSETSETKKRERGIRSKSLQKA